MKHTWELESKASISSEKNFKGNFLFEKKTSKLRISMTIHAHTTPHFDLHLILLESKLIRLLIRCENQVIIIKSTLSIIDNSKKTLNKKKKQNYLDAQLDDHGGIRKWSTKKGLSDEAPKSSQMKHQKRIVMYLGQPTLLHDCAYWWSSKTKYQADKYVDSSEIFYRFTLFRDLE